jgi:hypothetical protein
MFPFPVNSSHPPLRHQLTRRMRPSPFSHQQFGADAVTALSQATQTRLQDAESAKVSALPPLSASNESLSPRN